ncbi:MAG: hypothetical protein H8E41_04005 [Desulfobulbaceae bacterium]|uniref:DUF5666 domain-containing protein n=1 Tax=Candidatus Desulfobia pelagia TaxID=2841692 RepID=A0A8J6TF00_9BACT|nr:hypothetical protein [Candidatus Desulfobia pelagia]
MYPFSLLLIIAFLFPAQVFAEEYLRGTVISVDQQKGEVVVQPIEYSSVHEDEQLVENKNIAVTVRLPGKHRMRQEHKNRMFQCPAPGQQIRIRGEFDTESDLFLASDIRGCGLRGGLDPTGIRGRLGRDCDKDRPHRKNFGRRCSPERHGQHPYALPEQINDVEQQLQNTGN